jgi:hypothetical protein
MSGNKRFEICISNIEIKPLKNYHKQNLQYLNDKEKYYIHFDIAGYRQVLTEAQKKPWSWPLPRKNDKTVIYMTHHSHEFPIKTLSIYCKLKNKWTENEIVAQNEIDIHTIATGPNRFVLPLLHPIGNYNVCLITFDIDFVQILTDVEFCLKNIDVTEPYHRFKSTNNNSNSNCNLNVSLGYFDPQNSQWLMQHYPIKSSNIENPNQIVIKSLRLQLKMPIFATQFVRGSLHLVFWTDEKSSTQDLGRCVIPIIGNYDSENQTYLDVEENVLWHFKQENANNENILDKLICKLKILSGPSFFQMNHGLYTQDLLKGQHFIGFPVPKQTTTDQSIESVSLDEFISESCLCQSELEINGYSFIPEWFSNYKCHSTLFNKYHYLPQRKLSVQEVESNLKSVFVVPPKLRRSSTTNNVLTAGDRRQSIHIRSRSAVTSDHHHEDILNMFNYEENTKNDLLQLQSEHKCTIKNLHQLVLQIHEEIQNLAIFKLQLTKSFQKEEEKKQNSIENKQIFHLLIEKQENETEQKLWSLRLQFQLHLRIFFDQKRSISHFISILDSS